MTASPASLAVLARHLDALATEERFADLLARYVGPDVAGAALSRTPSIGGERLDASVLFIDVIGSTGLTERLSPGDMLSMLNALFDVVVRATRAEGGEVNKFLGDGAMAIFGAPQPHPAHREAALRCARRLTGEVQRLRADWALLDVGIGLSSGALVAGHVGCEDRFEFTVMGSAANMASRLSAAAKSHPARALACEATVRGGGSEAAHWRPSGRRPVQGYDRPVPVFTPDPS